MGNRAYHSEIWRAPDGTWTVRIKTYDDSGWKWTSFIGPYPNRELARKTQHCIKKFLNVVKITVVNPAY